jgi:peptide-methionine (S)-S-oxide reductase
MFGRPTEIPTVAQALPGRDQAMRFDPVHLVLGTSMVEPFPEDCDQIVLGLGCFWGAERLFWNLPGVHTTAVGYAAGHTPNPTYQEVCTGMTGHNEVVLVVYRRQQIELDALLTVFWESHDPTQGMRQGNDQGTQYRSGIYAALSAKTGSGRVCADYHGNSAGRPVLLCRGLSPAIPGKKSGGLLWFTRHRSILLEN